MNKKIMFITLALFIVVSIAGVSAADIDEMSNTDGTNTDLGDRISEEPAVIEINNTMTNDQIQEKLNTIKNNTVVNFAPGTYQDTKLIITNAENRLSNITINGNGAKLVGNLEVNNNTNYYDGLFEIQKTDGFNINGFEFVANFDKEYAPTIKTPSCVVIFDTSNGTFENNKVSGGRFGIYVGSKFTNPNHYTLVRNNTVTDVIDMGIISFGSDHTTIANNTVINPVNHGIDVRHGTGPYSLVEGNTIIGAMEGIYIMHSQNHQVLNNTLNHCAIGITCYGSSNVECDGNSFINNTKIGFLLSAGYSNIQIGENNNYTGLWYSPMPPTFQYKILKGDSTYVGESSGVFSESDSKTNITYPQVYIIGDDEGNPIELEDGSTTIFTDELLALNDKLTVKIWKFDDNNHIDADEIIKISIDGQEADYTTDDTGAVYIDLTKLSTGKHNIVAVYAGNNALKECAWSGTIQIGSDASTKIIYSNMTTQAVASIDGRVGKMFKVTLTDAYGTPLANKSIQIGFNGKVYNRVTDDNGSAELQINLGKAGGYTFAICFLGDDNYKSSFAVAKITVVPQTLKVSVPAKTYKASAKTKTLTATVLSQKGGKIAGITVTFKVNGKTYTAKTNANGIAKVNVSLTSKKAYSFTVSYAGDDRYAAFTKTSKVTIN